jgi:GAF domain/PilZ domain/Sel1 repeat
MAAITSEFRTSNLNRRRRVRHKIQTPAYATFTAEATAPMLDLYEIVDISEEGVSIQCPSPLEKDRLIQLCLDLAECPEQILTTGKVIWSNTSGRVGLHFADLPPESLFRLREWLFMNAMAGVANADDDVLAQSIARHVPLQPSYTDTLAAVTAVQREVEGLGPDLGAALALIASRSQSLVHASGAAIALATADPEFMECRATSGPDAPPVGTRLQVGSGFSGECVKTGQVLRCDDSELDTRVDRESCRSLGIRSILAVPIRVGEKSIGIIEAFSARANVFQENDSRVLQRMTEIVLAAMNRTARSEDLPDLTPPVSINRFAPTPGSVLFASAEPEAQDTEEKDEDNDAPGGISLPKSHLVLLLCFAATIAGALGYLSAPLIQSKLEQHGRPHLQTVLASTAAPKADIPSATFSVIAIDALPLDQLRQLANNGDAAAQNAIALRYFQGDEKDGVKQDEREAAHWFTTAAEHGNIAAQSKLGFLYWDGRGVPKDLSKAYLWTMIACGHGDSAAKEPSVSLSKTLAQFLHSQLTRDQATVIEHQAQQWLQQHDPTKKPPAGN